MGITDYIPNGQAISDIVAATKNWKVTHNAEVIRPGLAKLNALVAKWNLKVVAVKPGVEIPWDKLGAGANTLAFIVIDKEG